MTRRGGTAVAVAAMCLLCLLSGVSADVLKFDFGRSDRPRTMEGFTPVTVRDDYTDGKGFGWIGVQGEAAAGWLEERSPLAGCVRRSGDQQCGVDDLACDYVSGGGVFGVKVPDGKYVVWMMVGDWGAYEFYPRGKYTVLAEGKVVGELDHATHEKFKDDFFRHRDDVFHLGADLFEKYVEPRFRKYTAEVDVTDGRLELQVRRDDGPTPYIGPLNAVVVFPVAEKTEGEAFLKQVQDARKAYFDKKYRVVVFREAWIGDMKKEDNERGFAVWTQPYAERELWEYIPSRAVREDRKLEVMCSRGEMEPVVVHVYPLDRKPGRFECTVSPLKGDKGDVLPADTVSVRASKPWEMWRRAPASLERYTSRSKDPIRAGQIIVTPTPYFLLNRNWFEGEWKGKRSFWLTVKLPDTTVSHTYAGTVKVTHGDKVAEMTLNVTALPFKLPRLKQAVGLNYGTLDYPRWFTDSKDRFWDLVEKDLQLMYDYGMTTVAAAGRSLPKNPGDENQWEKFIQIYRKVGFERELYHAGLMTTYSGGSLQKEHGSPRGKAWQQAWAQVFRDYDAVAKKYDQKVIYSIGDESTNDGREQQVINAAKVSKELLDDLLIISDINGYKELFGMAPYIDAAGFNNGWTGSYGTNRSRPMMTRDVIERVKALGCSPWFINGGKGRYPFGIWFWKTTEWGVDGKIEWHYDASGADSYNPFDGTATNDFGSLVLPDQVSTLTFELCREGIDDLRYLRYLEHLVAGKGDAKDTFTRGVVARAKEVLTYYSDLIPDRFDTHATGDGSAVYSGDYWTPERLDEMRREIATHICMLQDTPVPGIYDDVMLVDGDTGYQPERQLGGSVRTWEKDSKYATQGKNCFKLTFKDGKGYADKWGRPPTKDRRGYRKLQLDVVNAEPRVVTVVLHLRDHLAANFIDDGELNRNLVLRCTPGKNSFAFDLVGITQDDGKRELMMDCMFGYYFTVRDEKADTTIYVDNMRLCPR